MEPVPSVQYQGPFNVEVYREKSPGLKRKFTLTNDRLIVEGKKGWGYEFQTAIPLLHADPVYGVIRRRSNISGPGALVLGVMIGLLFAFGVVHRPPKFFPVPAIIEGGLTVFCVGTGLWHLRKVEFYTFRGLGGGTLFDIARSGPDRERFDDFVARVIERIQMLQNALTVGAQTANPVNSSGTSPDSHT